MTRLAVVDHGAGNIVSIVQGLRRVGADVVVAEHPGEIGDAAGLVLPGVGRTGAAMERLEHAGFVGVLRAWERPLLGICVGMQLLFDASDEDGTPCLGIAPGEVVRLYDAPLLPHIGWNDVALSGDRLFTGLGETEPFYFVHSYAPVPTTAGMVIGTAEYGARFAAAIRHENVAGVQFHPERSGRAGLLVLRNFVTAAEEAAARAA